MEGDGVLTSGFRHQLQNIPEEEKDLTEAFKLRVGLKDGVQETRPMGDIERDVSLSKFKFRKFVETSYRFPQSSFTREPLKEPLTRWASDYVCEEQVFNMVRAEPLSAQIISHAIKQFCKDLTVSGKKHSPENKNNICALVSNNIASFKKHEQKQKENKPFKQNYLLKIFGQKQKRIDKLSTFEQLLESIPFSDLEVAQFIVAYGLLCEDLRDEIYCQLCEQVTNNPSEESSTCGWILHVLCSGCFMPTDKLLRYYISFINDAIKETSVDYAKQVLTLLLRVNSFGMRYYPPTSVEFLAVKCRKKIMLPVSLADGSVVQILSDAVTTSSEMCQTICKASGIKELFGFSINISVAGKVSSLGNGLDHVMDAIAECEQVLKRQFSGDDHQSQTSSNGPKWQLTFGKELFTPWHDAEADLKSTNLIYKQICRSVENGEFKFKSDDDLARFLARRCFIELGQNFNRESLQEKIKNFVPKTTLNGNDCNEKLWVDLILSAFDKQNILGKGITQLQMLCSIVESAQRKWPLQFSALFEVLKISGPPLPSNELVVAISCRGIFFLEEPYKILHGLHYYETVEVNCNKSADGKGTTFTLTTIKGECWTFVSANSETIAKILCTFLDGLRRRSKWAIVIEEFILRDHSKDSPNDYHLRPGDVVELLDETKQKSLKKDWLFGKSERTGKVGPFPYDSIYILPTSEKPPKQFMNLFRDMSRKDFSTLPKKRGAVVFGQAAQEKNPTHGAQSAI